MITLNTIGSIALSELFKQDPLKFSSIGSVVKQLLEYETSPVQLIVKKVGSSLELYKGDGATDGSNHLNIADYYLGTKSAGATTRYQWHAMDADADYPEAGKPLSLADVVSELADELTNGQAVVIDQTRVHLVKLTSFAADDFSEDLVAKFDGESAQAWE